jgi:hypothetical protein
MGRGMDEDFGTWIRLAISLDFHTFWWLDNDAVSQVNSSMAKIGQLWAEYANLSFLATFF